MNGCIARMRSLLERAGHEYLPLSVRMVQVAWREDGGAQGYRIVCKKEGFKTLERHGLHRSLYRYAVERQGQGKGGRGSRAALRFAFVHRVAKVAVVCRVNARNGAAETPC